MQVTERVSTVTTVGLRCPGTYANNQWVLTAWKNPRKDHQRWQRNTPQTYSFSFH